MQETRDASDHEAPRELLRGPPPVTTGRAPVTTGAKLPSSYGHQTSRVLHNPRPICTVFPSVHSVQVRQAASSGAPALTLTSTPAIRGSFPASSSYGEANGSFSIQPSSSSPHHPQAMHASKQLPDAQHGSVVSPRYSSPISGHSQSSMAGHSRYHGPQIHPGSEMLPQQRSIHTRPPMHSDANEQPAFASTKPAAYQPSLIEEYSSMSLPQQFGAQQAPLQLSARDLDPNLEAAFGGSVPHKPYGSSMHQHQATASRNSFSLRVGRICEDSAEGQDVAISHEPEAQASVMPHPKMPPANWLLESNRDIVQAPPMQPTGQPIHYGHTNHGLAAMPQQSFQQGRGPGPEILQDLDPPLPGMVRHPSNPGPAVSSQPFMDKSKSMPVMYPPADYSTPAAHQWHGAAPEGWLQGPSGILGNMPPEPGMLSDPPQPFAAEVPRSDAPNPPPNPFAMPQPHLNGLDGFGPNMRMAPGQAHQSMSTHAPHRRRTSHPSISGRSDPGVASTACHSPRVSTPFENSWHLGPAPQPMEFTAGITSRGSYAQPAQQDRSSHSSWDPSKQPSGSLTHLSHPSHPDLCSYVSSQTDNLADGPGYHLPNQDSIGPSNSVSAMYPYPYGDTWGQRSGVSSAQPTNGPLEPDFWQPIDVEAETARTDDASEPWTASLEGTSSMQLADLYTWLDNALESRPEDPTQPNAPDAAPAPTRSGEMSNASYGPHAGYGPQPTNGSLSGGGSELDEPGRSSHPAAGSKHRTLLLGEPRQRSRRRLSIDTNPFSVSGDEEIIAVPKSEMQAKEIEQQRLQQQVEEKQQACEILAMQLVDAQRRCQNSDGFPPQPALLTQQGDLLAPPS